MFHHFLPCLLTAPCYFEKKPTRFPRPAFLPHPLSFIGEIRDHLICPFFDPFKGPSSHFFLSDADRHFFPLKRSPFLSMIQVPGGRPVFTVRPVLSTPFLLTMYKLYMEGRIKYVRWLTKGRGYLEGRLEGNTNSLPSARISPVFLRLLSSRVTVSRVAPTRLAIS